MIKYIVTIFSIISLLFSCNNDLMTDNNSIDLSDKKDITLQERNPSIPKTKSQKRISTKYATTPIKADEFLGYGYSFKSWVTGDPENVGFRVLDINKIKSNTNYIEGARPIKKANSYIRSWESENSFTYDSTYTKTVNRGFNLNIGAIAFGKKKKVENTFNYLNINKKDAVYGELSAEIRDVNVVMNSTSSAKQRIATNYIDDDFLFEIYNNTIDQTIQDYGLFVLTNYIAGGRASVIYYGQANSDSSQITRKKDTSSSINTTLSWKNTADPTKIDSVGLSIGKITGNTVVTKEVGQIKRLYFQLHTIGGSYDYSLSTNVGKITEVTYNLDNWVKSLNDPDNCTLIEVSDNGLSPITDYIFEQNFKRRMQDTHLEVLNTSDLIDPYIEVVKVQMGNSKSNGAPLFDIFAVLNTRHGDKIILNDGNVRSEYELSQNLKNDVYLSKAKNIANQKRNFYQISIKANYNTKILPILRNPLSINLKGINENNMCKYLNTNTNIWYIYDPINLVAFSYYNDEYIPECYGMLDWINNIPEKSISINSLYRRYTVIGL